MFHALAAHAINIGINDFNTQKLTIQTIYRCFNSDRNVKDLSHSNTLHLIASAYNFKSYQAFKIAYEAIFGDSNNIVLQTPDTTLEVLAARIEIHIIQKLDCLKPNLVSKIIADYLIRSTSKNIEQSKLYTQPNLLIHLICNRYDLSDWPQSNHFQLFCLLQNYGHNFLDEESSFQCFKKFPRYENCFFDIRKSVQSSQQEALFLRDFLLKDYFHEASEIKGNKHIYETDDINKLKSICDFNSTLNFTKEKDLIISSLQHLLLKNSSLQKVTNNEDFHIFDNLNYLKNASIFKIECHSKFLDNMFKYLINGKNQDLSIVEIEHADELVIHGKDCLTFKISGKLENITFIQSIGFNLDTQQYVSNHKEVHKMQWNNTTNEPLLASIFTRIELNNGSEVIKNGIMRKEIGFTFLKFIPVSLPDDVVNSFSTLIDLYIQKLNTLIFSHRYPFNIFYILLIRNKIEQKNNPLINAFDDFKDPQPIFTSNIDRALDMLNQQLFHDEIDESDPISLLNQHPSKYQIETDYEDFSFQLF